MRLKIKKIIIFSIFILSICFILIGGINGYSMMLNGIKMRYSSLKSYDNTQIAILIAEPDDKNDRFKEKNYGVVVAHGILGKAESNLRLISELARAGFTVVALDERGHGNSGGRIERLHVGEKEYMDVVRCAQFLKKEMKCEKVILVGHSLGGIAVTRAAYWALKNNIINISGTIAISSAVGSNPDDTDNSDIFTLFGKSFSKTFDFEMSFPDFSDEMNKSAAPYNYLVIISENDEVVSVDKAKELCNLAGGAGKTSDADFISGNASDLFILRKEDNAPSHAWTPRDPRVIEKIIYWCEKSMQIKDEYDFDKDNYNTYWEPQDNYFQLAIFGTYLLLIPFYALVKSKILLKNRILDENALIEAEFKKKDILLTILIVALIIFISPLISKVFAIPPLQNYIFINIIVRDLIIAAVLILSIFLILKRDICGKIFNSKNIKRFLISGAAACIMLSIFLTGMILFDTYYDMNLKWTPFTFNPFIPELCIMFFTLLLEMLFIMAVFEFISRKLIQDRLFNAREKFSIAVWLKTSFLNGIIKASFLNILIIGLFFAYDFENLTLLFGPPYYLIIGLFIISLIIFIITDFILTALYQHSKDFWFVIIACYGYFAILASCIFIRI
ncbi:MAG: alpha/beta hydrolase family protein [Promethearchaeota archaeon]